MTIMEEMELSLEKHYGRKKALVMLSHYRIVESLANNIANRRRTRENNLKD